MRRSPTPEFAYDPQARTLIEVVRLIKSFWETSRSLCLWVLFSYALAAGSASVTAVASGSLIHDREDRFALAVVIVSIITMSVGFIAGAQLCSALAARWGLGVQARLGHVVWGQSVKDLENKNAGDLASRMERDVGNTATKLEDSARAVILGVFTFLSVAVATWRFSHWLTLILVVLVLGALGLCLPTLRALQPAQDDETFAWVEAAGLIEETIWAEEDMRGVSGKSYALGNVTKVSGRQLRVGRVVWKLQRRNLLVMQGVGTLFVIATLIMGYQMLQRDALDMGELSALWFLAGQLLGVLGWVASVATDLIKAGGAWARIEGLLTLAQERTGGESVDVASQIEFRDVSFSYGDNLVLKGINLKLRPGVSYAVLGRTGSGKSTLVKLLLGLEQASLGEVLISGKNISALDLTQLRSQIGVISQKADLYPGTVMDNITLFQKDQNVAVEGVIAKLGLQDWVTSLPEGLETEIGEGGLRLSAGAEQLIGFARLMLRDVKLVVMDEATARLDPMTEGLIVAASEVLLSGRTSVIIAHRLASVARCNEMIVLENGRVIEAGPITESSHYENLLDLAGGISTSDEEAEHVVSLQGETVEQEAPGEMTLRQFVADMRGFYGRYKGLLFRAKLYQFLQDIAVPGGVLTGLLWAKAVGEGALSLPLLIVLISLISIRLVPSIQGIVTISEWWVRNYVRLSIKIVDARLGGARKRAISSGEAMSLATSVGVVVDYVEFYAQILMFTLLLVVASLLTGSWLPLVLTGPLLVAPYVVGKVLRREVKSSGIAASRQRDRIFKVYVGTLSAARSVKLSGAERGMLLHVDTLVRDLWKARRRSRRVRVVLEETPVFVSALATIGLWIGYVQGHVSTAVLLSAASVINMTGYFGWLVSHLVAEHPVVLERLRKIHYVLGDASISEDVEGGDFLSVANGGSYEYPQWSEERVLPPLTEFALENVSVIHEDGRRVVRECNLSVERGDVVLLLGRIGSGKSSLLRAVAGLVAYEGEVRWNEAPVSNIEVLARPPHVAYVAQLPRLITGTVEGNVSLGRVAEEIVFDALESAQMHTDIESLAQGQQTIVGYKGLTLSGGQVQRLALARALASEADLLVMDDVSSALDIGTELELWDELRESGRTILGASHKKAALAKADVVIIMEEGRISDSGAWRDLEEKWGSLAS